MTQPAEEVYNMHEQVFECTTRTFGDNPEPVRTALMGMKVTAGNFIIGLLHDGIPRTLRTEYQEKEIGTAVMPSPVGQSLIGESATHTPEPPRVVRHRLVVSWLEPEKKL